MKKQILILTMSDKHKDPVEGGYCVAGIDMDEDGKWVRLIGANDHCKITDREARYPDGTLCRPLDLIEVEVAKMDRNLLGDIRSRRFPLESGGYLALKDYSETMFEIQPENYLASGRFRFIRRAEIEEVLNLVHLEDKDYIYLNNERSLDPDQAVRNHESLTMVKVDNLKLYPKKKHGDDGYQAHYRASFEYNGVTYEDLSVTDPEYEAELTEYAGLDFGESYLIMSVGEKYAGRHYKMIAKIFEVVYTVDGNKFNLFHAFRDCSYLSRYPRIKHALYGDLTACGMKQCRKCSERKGLQQQ